MPGGIYAYSPLPASACRTAGGRRTVWHRSLGGPGPAARGTSTVGTRQAEAEGAVAEIGDSRRIVVGHAEQVGGGVTVEVRRRSEPTEIPAVVAAGGATAEILNCPPAVGRHGQVVTR